MTGGRGGDGAASAAHHGSVRIGVGVSTAPDARTSAVEAAAHARDGLAGEAPSLAVLLGSRSHTEQAVDVLNAVQEMVEPPALIGCVAQAIVAGRHEIEDEAAVAVWLASGLAAETFQLDFVRTGSGGLLAGYRFDRTAHDLYLLLPDPYTFPSNVLVEHLNTDLPGTTVVGGVGPASRWAPAWTPTSTRRKMRATSCCGRRQAGRAVVGPRHGNGRPGWHIECSAMAMGLLGERRRHPHGGIDLVFPAPRERDRPERRRHRQAVLALLGAHRAPDRGRPEDVEVARQLLHDQRHHRARVPGLGAALPAALGALSQATQFHMGGNATGGRSAATPHRFPRPAGSREGGEAHPEILRAVTTARAAFDEALSDDLNTAAGLACMFDLVRTVNTAIDQKQIGEEDVAMVRKAFDHFDDVLGVLSLRRGEDREPPMPEAEIQAAIEARHAARRARNFAEADRIRDDMAARA